MKKIKTIYKALIIFLIISACTEEDRSLDFLNNIAPPTNVAAAYNLTQDNSGLVTIIPTADGATLFDVDLGDSSPVEKDIELGKNVQHTYAEGNYTVKIVAYNIKGDAVEATQELVVSFKAPQNLVAALDNDAAVSKQVNITATADYAATYEFYSGEADITQPAATGNIGDVVNYQYAESGIYSVKVIAKGGAIETTEYTEDFEVTEILAPVTSTVTPPARNDVDVISIFSDAYTDVAGTEFNPNWSQNTIYTAFDLNGDAMLQYSNLNYQGIVIGSEIDASSMEILHLDIWTPDATSIDIYPLPNGVQPADEKFVTKVLTANSWTTINIPMSDFTDQGLPVDMLKQFKFVGAGTVFIDNIYFYKAPSPTGTPIVFDDFEGNGNISTWAGDDCGMDNAFANPFKDALNDSDTVLEYNDTGGQYANVRFDKDSDFDLSGGNSVFTLKIYVPSSSVTGSQPNQLSLKLQDSDSNPWERQSEIIKEIALDTWQTVSFDFENDDVLGVTNPLSITNFRRVVLQVNSENNNDNVIAYLDDLSYGNETAVDTAPFVKDSFEGDGTITTWAGDDCGMNNTFANPFKDALNDSDTVLEYNDTGGQYANVRFDISPDYDLNAKSKFSLKIYVPSSSISGSQPNQISLKLQDSDGNPWERQSEIIKEIALDTWQEVTFDFASDTVLGVTDALSITNFSRVVLQVNSENNNDTVIAYIDDINYYN
ncbi:hypothetical protein [Polaribacter sp. SA4-12]|uniref:hypothetical protein n=1 Tax=Polaribacter sp. SA4-12 TaxID=1312072 RepID=UPI000B3CB186|nr:hypothetical protein [Polaribacter sp. SA4-12]ARV14430.1 hypothetical protein BTO07_04370 [Polaribacter sp. SA4-12]